MESLMYSNTCFLHVHTHNVNWKATPTGKGSISLVERIQLCVQGNKDSNKNVTFIWISLAWMYSRISEITDTFEPATSLL